MVSKAYDARVSDHSLVAPVHPIPPHWPEHETSTLRDQLTMERVEEPTPHGRLRANELQERKCDADRGEELHLAGRDEAIPTLLLKPLMNPPAEAPPGPESHGTPRKPPSLNGIEGRRTASSRIEKHICIEVSPNPALARAPRDAG